MASSCIVIKVKFGETLCRLNATVDDAKKLDLDIVMLKEKIFSLFGFGSDVEFTMTYIDEDGDVVTLATNDDLNDVVRQSLNPLKINVKLNNGNIVGPSGQPGLLRPLDILRDQQLQQQQQQQQLLLQYQTFNSGFNYPPMQSQPQFIPPNQKPPQQQQQQQQLPYRAVNSGVSGNLKPVPGPAELLQKAAYLTQIAASMIGAMMQPPAPSPNGGASSVDGIGQQVPNAESPTFGTLRFP